MEPRPDRPDAASTERGSAEADRRTDERVLRRRPVEVTIETSELRGTTENVSRGGVLLASRDPLRVRLVLDTEHGPVERTGKLVRIQRLDETVSGLAVEFDPE